MGLTVITGGGGGFGRAAGIRFGLKGPVLLTNRSTKKLEDNLNIMKALGIECRAAALDTSDRDSCFAAAKIAKEYAAELGTEITAVVNIAGISGNYAPGANPMGQLTINAMGVVNMTDAFYDVMAPGAAMIHFASMAAYYLPMFNDKFVEIYKTCTEPGFVERMFALVRAMKGLPARYEDFTEENKKEAYEAGYCLSKNFVIWYSQANVKKFAKKNMRIISISPGTHFTTHVQEMSEKVAKEQMALNPLKRWGSPFDMADACAFLCGETAKYFTGCDILIDGGSTHGRTVYQFE